MNRDTAHSPRVDGPAVVIWLCSIYIMVFLMVLIGGITRLTGSGLSMVEWHPLMGALPPMSEEHWVTVFEKYKQFPQYQLVNGWMDLAAFKKIFFWEYLHRLFGRLIGIAVFLPWLFFLITRRLSPKTKVGALIAIALGGAQGILGWYMVKSGLVDVPAVSHFRLAAHLLLALLVSQWVLWMILNVAAPWRETRGKTPGGSKLPLVLLGMTYLQIMYGAFVSGKRAGYLSSTFPDMNGHYLPTEFFTGASWLIDAFNNPLSIHYLHRAIAVVLLIALSTGAARLITNSKTIWGSRLGKLLLGMIAAQFMMGVGTVMLGVQLHWAVAHQGGAVILLGIITALLHLSLRGTAAQSEPFDSAPIRV